MPSWQEEPRAGHTVWKYKDGNGVNGKIEDVDRWGTRLVFVVWYPWREPEEKETIPYDDFIGCADFNEHHNQWVFTPL